MGTPLLLYGGVEASSTPTFCGSCHELRPAVASWAASPHGPRDGQARASCRDCHVPAWSEPLEALLVKGQHGAKDVYHHLRGGEELGKGDFYFRLKAQARRSVDDEVCLRCHADIRGAKDVIKTEAGEVRGLHGSDEARRVRCLSCHKNTAHGFLD